MQGKMVLRLVIERFIFMAIFALLIVLVPKLKALRLVEIGRLMPDETVPVNERVRSTAED
jgi:hypothetical protein